MPKHTVRYTGDHELGKIHPTDAGTDLRIAENVSIHPGQHVSVSTGIAFEIPPGLYGEVHVRSSIGIKRHTCLSNGTGIIDADYRGPVYLSLHNTGDTTQHFTAGERIGQIIFHELLDINLLPADELGDTERGTNGIGSTGR